MDSFRHPAQAHLIKAGATWIRNALKTEKFEVQSNECEKVWCVDGHSIYFCNNDPTHEFVKGQYAEIAKRLDTLIDTCGEEESIHGEIRNSVSHVRVQWDEHDDCYVRKPEDF
ncbi:hypothetical protein ASPVEDRAFT_29864 [Aspergillus versicolor CBS 583.65]|uniref:Uncharacterized protein n=1 Tax=Aspergillus versicolor CBS 583.65 TaxID=1036611 RepID=A0A1L9PPC1_ASPVE|nr:uncharacterized protein ASPVEDRAFT_29864 [Aspergillus versicolor CBS 583.65]OJJ03341.1 hypothetical protein ASPVEDRAFT_29864 [Aspergillus versicolor CBS 583.65]